MDVFMDIDLKNEKVKRIINAGFEEFGRYGEVKASLNKILKNSGISKGVFYHYFKDKDDLLKFLIAFSIEKSVYDLDRQVEWSEGDFIKRICEYSKCRMALLRAHPYLMEFFDQFKDRVTKELDNQILNDWREKFYKLNIDYSLFKSSVCVEDAIYTIRWTFKGVGLDRVKAHGNHFTDEIIDDMMKDFDHYYKFLVDVFYE